MTSDPPSADVLQSQIDRQLPLRPGLSIRAGAIEDRQADLFPSERSSIEQAVERRRWEFASGRAVAREAMREAGLQPGPIVIGGQREPVWPAGLTGSSTHTGDLVVASVASKERFLSLGVDLEIAGRVTSRIHRKILTTAEAEAVTHGDPRLPALLFSAKEAGYKATRPLAGRFIGFQEASVEVDWSLGRFRFRYLGEHEPNRIMESAEGHFLFCEPYVLSLVIIPAKD